MAVRIQLRRDTAANWVSNNPVLRDGELGIETDTLKIKIGNGSAWNSISNYANVVPSDLNTTLNNYLTITDIGAQGGVVGLNNSYNAIIPGSSIILEGPTADSYETTLTVTDPTADRTITLPDRDGTVITTGDTGTVTNAMLAGSIANNKLTNSSVTINGYEIALGASASYGTDNISEGTTNKYFTDERAQDATAAALAAGTHTNITVTYDDNANSISLAAAPGYVDEQAVDAVAAALAAGTHTNITVSYNDNANSISLTGAQTYSDENAQDAIGNALGSGLSYNDSTGAISVDTTVIQARVSGVSDTEIGYLDGVTSSIQNQINAKASSDNPTFTTGSAETTVAPAYSGGQGSTTAASMVDYGYSGNYGGWNPGAVSSVPAGWPNIPGNMSYYIGKIFVISGSPVSHQNGEWPIMEAGTSGFGSPIHFGLGGGFIGTNQGGGEGYATVSVKTPNTLKTVSATELGYLDGVTSAIQTQLNAKAPINNPTFTGTVTLAGAPSSANEAATKAYVDNITAGLNFHAAVHAATTANLSATYNNGAGTLSASGAFPTIDGETIVETERVLVKSQSDAKQNGIYVLTDDGDPSGTWVLTRASDADNSPSGEIAYGDFVFVQTGSTNGGYGYIMTTTGTITLGTSNINWTQFNAGQTVVAGNGLTETTPGTLAINTGVTVDLNTAQTLTNKTITGTFTGNLTGNADTATNGVVTTGSYSNPSWITSLGWSKISSTPTTLSGYGITDALASATAASTYLTQSNAASTYAPINNPTFTGTVSGITKTMVGLGNVENTALSTWAGSTNITTLGTIATGTWSGTTIATTKGGTGLTSYATGDILYASATNTLSKLTAGTNGQILTLAAGVPTWAAAPAGYSAPTIGSTSIASGATVTQINGLVLGATSTTTVNSNTATTIDTNALSGFTTVKYLVSIKQGSKIRSSQIIAQTDGTSVDYAEFGVVETGGNIYGVLVAASASGSNCLLQVTIADAATTNATVKIHKVLI